MTENTSLTSIESGFVSLTELKIKETATVEIDLICNKMEEKNKGFFDYSVFKKFFKDAVIFKKFGKAVNSFKEMGKKTNLMAKKSWRCATNCFSSISNKNLNTFVTNNCLLITFLLLLVVLIEILFAYFSVNYKYIKSDKKPDLFLIILHASFSFYLFFLPVFYAYIIVFKVIPSVRPSLTSSKWFLIISKIVPNLFVSILLSLLFIIIVTLCFYFGFSSHTFNDKHMDYIILIKIGLLIFYISLLTYLINFLPKMLVNTLIV
ncbi:unnamed protein product [Meloidogyne enterolobii]|uniref:Uncharacterized protein n=1 Tax=Meloidogyne enterolobii TaxID=390850 RepID=A0ACB1ATV2_MELEN